MLRISSACNDCHVLNRMIMTMLMLLVMMLKMWLSNTSSNFEKIGSNGVRRKKGCKRFEGNYRDSFLLYARCNINAVVVVLIFMMMINIAS